MIDCVGCTGDVAGVDRRGRAIGGLIGCPGHLHDAVFGVPPTLFDLRHLIHRGANDTVGAIAHAASDRRKTLLNPVRLSLELLSNLRTRFRGHHQRRERPSYRTNNGAKNECTSMICLAQVRTPSRVTNAYFPRSLADSSQAYSRQLRFDHGCNLSIRVPPFCHGRNIGINSREIDVRTAVLLSSAVQTNRDGNSAVTYDVRGDR